MARKRQINLLQVTSFEHSVMGKLIAWASNVGRWIIVLTEFVVITAFLSRFYFDTKLANLFDEVRQKKAIVNSSYAFEEQYRQARNKILLAKIVLEANLSTAETVSNIASKIPLDVTLTSLSIDVNSLTLNGHALSSNGLQLFINGLSQNTNVSDLKISKLGARLDGLPGIEFSVTGLVNNKT